jgi:pilus assembly protein CpaD
MPILKSRPRGRLLSAGLNVAALAVVAVVSAGCGTTTGTSDVDMTAYDPRVRHPIMISNEPETFEIPVGMSGPALSRQIDTALRVYVRGYRESGTGNITIQVPTGSANEIAASSTGQAVHYALVRAGVPHNQILVAPYFVGDHSKAAPLRISYLRVKAVASECGIWPSTVPGDQNGQYYNFGCAAQQNLAAMVANPADLVAPQPMSPANGARRAHVITTYEEKGNEGWDPAPHTGLIESGSVEGL